MKKTWRFISLFCAFVLMATACGRYPIPPIFTGVSSDVLYLNLTWHQHQPLYYKDADGVYTRPWVRVHGTKDYYDMAATVAKYPNVHVTFNLTPVLLMQIQDYVQDGAKDRYWTLAEKPADKLTVDEKDFILRRFFDANWDHIIRVHPGYKALLDKRGGTTDDAIAEAMTSFSEQDFRDLQIWFNLAWFDPDNLATDPLKALVDKDRGFSEADKAVIFSEVRRVMAEIIPIHKKLQDAGQIEVITTPYAHPILPLIFDTNLAKIGNPQAELPKRFNYPQDVIGQLNKSAELYTQIFGKAPKGLWPAEGAVAQQIVPFVSNAGYQWMASGEQVLANSLGIGSFTRNGADTVQEADALYRLYIVEGPVGGPIQGKPVMMVFRDLLISDKLGFTYSGTPGEQAADDFMQRMENIRAQLKSSGAQGPHLVSVILDGENAWENYDNDGKVFLNALYARLSESKTVKTITPSEYLKKFPDQKKLDTLFPGAWFSPNYDTWIGESEENTAWNYLGQVRKDLAQYDTLKKKSAPSSDALQKAVETMYLAEGSDWFWWYGNDQDSGNDSYFDEDFRALLAQVYENLGEPVPSFVKVPIIPRTVVIPQQPGSGTSTPTIDGRVSADEWVKATYYPMTGGAQGRSEALIAGIYFGVDAKNMYVRVDAREDWSKTENARIGFYAASPRQQNFSGMTRLSLGKETPYLLGFGATLLAEMDLEKKTGQLFTPQANEWQPGEAFTTAAVDGKTLEFSFPLSALGEVQSGDEINAVVVASSGERDLQSAPESGLGQLLLPELAPVEYFLDVTDPNGDDHGLGSYTYPTDPVFLPGSFDLTRFKVGTDGSNLVFRFELAGEIHNPWNGPANFSVQTLDVYIDKDPGSGSGARLLLPGRNASLTKGNGWEYALWAESWTPQVVAPDKTTLQPKQVNGASFRIVVDLAATSIILRAPLSIFGEGDPKQWGYLGAVLGQEGYPADGVWRVRDVEPQSAQWRFGGGKTDVNHTRIIDLAWSAESKPSQEEMLSAYPARETGGEALGADDYAQLDLLLP